MHSYASDSPERKVGPWVIAVIAVGLTYLFAQMTRMVNWDIPWWVEAPSVMSLYGLLHWVHNRWGWRWRPGPMRLSSIPDFGGTWYGGATSTHNGETSFEGMLTIHQTWTQIVVQYQTDSSTSCSRMAAINVTPGSSQGLVYEYMNDPHSTAAGTMHAHRGFAFLKQSADGEWLEGEYYTGRDRASQGRLRLRRVSPKPVDRNVAKAAYSELRKAEK